MPQLPVQWCPRCKVWYSPRTWFAWHVHDDCALVVIGEGQPGDPWQTECTAHGRTFPLGQPCPVGGADMQVTG